MLELVLGIALAIALWNWAYWMARKKDHSPRPQYIYVSPPPPPPSPVRMVPIHPHYAQDDQGRLWEVSNHRIAKCVGPVSPHTIDMLSDRPKVVGYDMYHIHDGSGELVAVRRPVYERLDPNTIRVRAALPPGEETFWKCQMCGEYENAMQVFCGWCGNQKGMIL